MTEPTAEPTAAPQSKEVVNWGMLCHLSALAGFIGIPLGNIIAPLVIWLLKKNDSPFIDEQGKESLNFQFSMLLYAIVSALLIIIIIGVFLLIGIAIADIVLVIIASIKVSGGKPYRYPLTIRFLK